MFVKLAETTLTTTQSSITFSGIPQTYTHLYIYWSVRSNAGTNIDNLEFRFNNDTSMTNYWQDMVTATNASFFVLGQNGNIFYRGINGGTTNASVFSGGTMTVYKYSSNTAGKAFSSIYGSNSTVATSSVSGKMQGKWSVSTPITSLSFIPGNGSFVANTVISLYALGT